MHVARKEFGQAAGRENHRLGVKHDQLAVRHVEPHGAEGAPGELDSATPSSADDPVALTIVPDEFTLVLYGADDVRAVFTGMVASMTRRKFHAVRIARGSQAAEAGEQRAAGTVATVVFLGAETRYTIAVDGGGEGEGDSVREVLTSRWPDAGIGAAPGG